MNFAQRPTVYTDLQDYCHMAKPHEIVEVTEWTNGEGWDIALGNRTFQLTMGELQALNVLCNVAHPKEIV
jgi:hypothetical protein